MIFCRQFANEKAEFREKNVVDNEGVMNTSNSTQTSKPTTRTFKFLN